MERRFGIEIRNYLICIVLLLSIAGQQVLAATVVNVPAVDTSGKGILTQIEATAVSGTGEIFVDITPFISIDTQQSAKTAAEMAAQVAGVSLGRFDVFYKVNARTQTVDGPSGGAALALLAYAEFAKLQPRKDLVVTGTIERDGSIGQIGGIVEKTKSLKGTGAKLFLIPHGQSIYQGTDVAGEAAAFGIQVAEVRNINDLVKYAFTPEGTPVQAEEFNEQPLVLEKLELPEALNPLKQIAAGELFSMEKDLDSLGSGKEAQLFRQLLETELNESRYALDMGYYYSAANSVFISRLSLDAFKLRNTTQIDLMRLTQQLANEAKTIEFPKESAENLEWVVGAKLRYYWALNKIKGIKQTAGSVPAEQLYSEYAAAKSWIGAAEKMSAIAKNIQSKTAFKNQDGAREYAEKLVLALNESQVFMIDSEIRQHYDGAVAALEKGDFATAVFDGLFAKSLAESDDKISRAVGSELTGGLLNSSDIPQYANSTWAQYYFIHALYNQAQANRTNDFAHTANAIKLQDFSLVLREEISFLKEILLQGGGSKAVTVPPSPLPGQPETGGMVVRTTVIPTQTEGFFSDKNVIVMAIIGIGAILLFLLARKTVSMLAPGQPPSTFAEKIERLDEMLIHGKISERNWEILHERYLRKLREESAFGNEGKSGSEEREPAESGSRATAPAAKKKAKKR